MYDAFPRVSIEREALVTTPFQQAANRIKEIARGDGRHGSCGMGVGETMSDWLAYGSDVLFAGDLSERDMTAKKLRRIREIKLSQLEPFLVAASDNKPIAEELKIYHDPDFIDATADLYQHFARQVSVVEADYLGSLLNIPGTTIFEGAQGVLLDEWYGFYPYNTWSTLTYKNADTLLAENGFNGESLRLGLIRGYATRHGAGPFVTEDEHLTSHLQDKHNGNNPWQREFRVGYLDFVALRYALKVTGKVDGIVVTNLDRMSTMDGWRVCDQYQTSLEASLARDYFDFEGGDIQDIKVPADPTDLIRQETLTNLLYVMKPIYKTCERDEACLLDMISRIAGAPVLYTSHGPTALDKYQFEYPLSPSQHTKQLALN